MKQVAQLLQRDLAAGWVT